MIIYALCSRVFTSLWRPQKTSMQCVSTHLCVCLFGALLREYAVCFNARREALVAVSAPQSSHVFLWLVSANQLLHALVSHPSRFISGARFFFVF